MQPAAAASTAATATAAVIATAWESVTDHDDLIHMILDKQVEMDILRIDYSTLKLQSDRAIKALPTIRKSMCAWF